MNFMLIITYALLALLLGAPIVGFIVSLIFFCTCPKENTYRKKTSKMFMIITGAMIAVEILLAISFAILLGLVVKGM